MYNPFKDFVNLLNEADGHPRPHRKQTLSRPKKTRSSSQSINWQPAPVPSPPSQRNVPPPSPPPNLITPHAPAPPPAPQAVSTVMYHGTPKKQNAFDIFYTNTWIIGPSSPKGIYVTPDFNTALQYAKGEGAVVALEVHSPQKLKKRTSTIYYLKANEGKNGKYCWTDAFTPAVVYNRNGEPLAWR